MSNSVRLSSLLALAGLVASASAIAISLVPPSTPISPGALTATDLNIAGLSNPPSAGAFDFTVSYDPTLLLFTGVSFGQKLGDPSLAEALTSFNSIPGSIEFAEVSLLSPADLDALQSPAFTLATLSFQGLASGTPSFSLTAGVVDDAFGNKLISIPEPGTLVLLGPILIAWILTQRGKRARPAAIGSAILAFLGSQLGAQTTTQKTKPNQIAATGRSADPPRPAAPNVCVQHTVTVDAKTGTAMLKAEFTNKDKNPKSFVFCQMIGVNDAEMVAAAECDIFKDGNTIKCKRSTRRFTSALDTFHFGCKQINLAANEKKTLDYGSGQNDKFKGKKASDFKVTYADYVQLNAGVTFDEASCTAAMCFGKNANTGLIGTPEIMGDWYLPKLPFDDPYLTYQPICTAPLAREYRSLSLSLATPSTFPATVPQLPRNVPSSIPPSYSVPLNLFDIYTMGADSPSVTAQLSVQVTPSLFQTDLVTSPPPNPATFVIPGGAESFGSLTFSRPTSANEGDSADFSVIVHLPDSASGLGPALFAEKGLFIEDRNPPSVSRHSLLFDSSNLLHVDVTATDAVTTPLSAELWYSLDGGLTWTDFALTPTSDLFDDSQHTRVFSGDVGVFAAGSALQYFVTVQDEVFNMNFLGVGQATATLSCDINGDGKVDNADIQLIFSARGRTASPGDARDVDRDCMITVNDARECVLRCTNPNCAP